MKRLIDKNTAMKIMTRINLSRRIECTGRKAPAI
jgi:hypothetical protein